MQVKKIGLTGGIGSGKTIVAKIFSCLGIPIYYSDAHAKRIMNSHDDVKREIQMIIGRDSYNARGELQTAIVAAAIFSNPQLRIAVNSIVHPIVRQDFSTWANASNAPYVIMESALLFESDLHTMFDANIYVWAAQDTRIHRVMQRDTCTKEQVLQRMKMQCDDEFCMQKFQFIVENNNTFVIPQVLQIHEEVLNL